MLTHLHPIAVSRVVCCRPLTTAELACRPILPTPEGKSEKRQLLETKLHNIKKVLKERHTKNSKPNTIESLEQELDSGYNKFGEKISKARRDRVRKILRKLR